MNRTETMITPEPGQMVVIIGHNKGEKRVLELGDVGRVLSVSKEAIGVSINDLPYGMDLQNIRPMLSGEKIRYHLGQEKMKIRKNRLPPDTFAVIKHAQFIKENLRGTLQERSIVMVRKPPRSILAPLSLISFEDEPDKQYVIYSAALRAAAERDIFLYHIHGKYALIEQNIPEEPEEEDV